MKISFKTILIVCAIFLIASISGYTCSIAFPAFNEMRAELHGMEVTTMPGTDNQFVIFTPAMANIVAQYHNYENAEALKAAYGFGASAKIAHLTSTNEIIIVCNGSIAEYTDLFGGWN